MRQRIAFLLVSLIVLLSAVVFADDYRFADEWWLEGTVELSSNRARMGVVLQEGFLGNVGVTAAAAFEGDFKAGTISTGLEEVYASGSFTPYTVWFVGRRKIAWGPDNYGLMLSGTAPAFDSWGYELRALGVRYSRFYGWLSPGERRLLLGHRLETEPIPELRLGISEAAVVSGNFSPLMLNPIPFWPLYMSQYIANTQIEDHNHRANLALGFDVRYNFGSDGFVFWEYMADDRPQHPQDRVPYHTAWRVGGSMTIMPKEGVGIDALYTVVNAGTYYHDNPENYWTHREEFLGFPLGSDVERLDLSVRCQLDDRTSLRWIWIKTMRGQGAVPEAGGENEVEVTGSNLTGLIEKSDRIGIGWEHSLSKDLVANVSIYQDWVKNPGNAPGEETHAGFELKVKFRFSE